MFTNDWKGYAIFTVAVIAVVTLYDISKTAVGNMLNKHNAPTPAPPQTNS